MQAVHLPSNAKPEEVAATLRENGYVIVDNLVSNELMDRIDAEMSPYIEKTSFGSDAFLGLGTKRTGRLILRSPAARELIMNETAIGTTKLFLDKATSFHIHLTQVISVYPGSPLQSMHRDQVVFDFFPFPQDYDVQCNILWAMTDYTEEMGATRVVPFSHLDQREDYTFEDSVPAEMSRGSALFYTGKVFHGAGANNSDRIRQAINLTYAVGWLRQEENQYLATPLEVAKTLPEDLQRVMGYQLGCFGIGYVGDFEDPMSVVRPEAATVLGTSDVQSQSEGSEAAAFLLEASKSGQSG